MSDETIVIIACLCYGKSPDENLTICILCLLGNLDSVSILKYLFGIPHEMGGPDTFPKENINYIQDLTALLSAITSDDEYFSTSVMRIPLSQV